ncbi:general transcription factor II-I repeat domain-containing protein 2-like [Belonocnema kinseyi]|uniref:general transcription factor II-I repeat domain-containing protein 2-like n=1 Tax=Belonocnema kinseyi TaxID=2817044 RepID=UPI00143D4C3A|nr:general transcription factor II-I repeat domain-containing protein 2-like [Belonocnema kinseyi]
MECNSTSSNLSSVVEDSTKAGISEQRLKKTEKRGRTYSFSIEWEEEIFQIGIDQETCYCLLCRKKISMNQKLNLKRHFDTCHAEVDHSHPLGSALRAERLQQLKAELSQRCGKVKNGDIVSTNPHDCTLASFDISFQIAKAMKPFTDGDFIKNVIIQAVTRWFPDEDNRREFVNIVQNTHLFPATITRRLDESTDKSDTAQLVVTQSMTGKITGFTGQCLRDPDFPRFLSFHCIIHQEVLCEKTLNIKTVFEVVEKVINSFRARALQHRLFKLLLENASAEFADLLLLNEVRWLSAGEVVIRFFNLLPEILAFLESRGEHCDEFYDSAWILDLEFLADVLKEINVLNKTLQMQHVAVWTCLQWINQFKKTIDRWISIIQRRTFTEELKNVQHAMEQQSIMLSPEVEHRYLQILKELKKDFEERFEDYDTIKLIFNYLTNPLIDLEVPYMEELCAQMSKLFQIDENKAVNEMIRLSTASWTGMRCEDFWRHLEFSEYPNLITVFQRILFINGTTCRCESMFSLMKNIKSKTRSSINDGNLNDVMWLEVTTYTPNIEALAQKMRLYTRMH